MDLKDILSGVQTGFQSKKGANALIGLGTGLLSGNTFAKGLAAGGQGYMQGAQLDDAEAQRMDRTTQWKSAIENIRTKYNRPDVADMLESAGEEGINAAWGEVIKGNAPADPLKPTSSMQEYQFAQSQGYDGTFQQYETDMKKAGATSIDFNQNQGVAAGFADRMAAANAILDDPKLTSAQTDPVQGTLGAIPGVGNYLTTKERQMADQAQRDFVNAILRRESGAAIAPSEFDNASKQYFPQPGDTKEVIAQKAQNRQIAIQGVTRAAGPSYQAPPAMDEIVDYTTYLGGQ